MLNQLSLVLSSYLLALCRVIYEGLWSLIFHCYTYDHMQGEIDTLIRNLKVTQTVLLFLIQQEITPIYQNSFILKHMFFIIKANIQVTC